MLFTFSFFSARFTPTNKARQDRVSQPQLSLLLIPTPFFCRTFRPSHFLSPFSTRLKWESLTQGLIHLPRFPPLTLIVAQSRSPRCTFPQIPSAVLRQLGISVPGLDIVSRPDIYSSTKASARKSQDQDIHKGSASFLSGFLFLILSSSFLFILYE